MKKKKNSVPLHPYHSSVYDYFEEKRRKGEEEELTAEPQSAQRKRREEKFSVLVGKE